MVKKVLVIEGSLLFNAGVRSLLIGAPDLDVQDLELEEFIEFAGYSQFEQPDIIVVDRSTGYSNVEKMAALLNRYPQVRLILLDLLENQIEIYDKSRFEVCELSDFFAAL